MKRLVLLCALCIAGVALSGCGVVGLMTTAEHNASLATVKRAEQNISTEHLEWSAKIAGQPDAKPLPDLSAFTPAQKTAWYHSREVRKQELDRVLNPTTQPAP